MGQVISYLDVELRSRNKQYERDMARSDRSNRRFARSAQKATNSSKAMGDSISRAANSVAVIDGPLGGVAGRLSSVAAGFNSVGVAATAAGVAIAATVAVAGKGVTVFAETERQLLRTEALLKSTGNASGLTAGFLDRQARDVARGTLASTKGIRDAQAVLLTFKSVSGDTFNRTIHLAQDMAATLNTEAKTAVLQLGKALEDPKRGLTSLTRSGVTFNEVEQEKIKALAESGRLLEAQSLLLDKVAGQFSGAASREAQGFSGAVDTLSQSFDELTEAIVRTTGTGDGLTYFINRVAKGMDITRDAILPTQTEDLFNRRIELLGELAEAEDKAGKFSTKDTFAGGLPVPGIYKKKRREAFAEVRELEVELKKIDKIMQDRVNRQDDIIEGEKDAYLAAQKYAEESQKATVSAKERAKALEKAQKIMEKQGSLWQKIFGGGSQRKTTGPVIDNSHFNFAALKAKGSIETGNASSAKQFIEQMEQVLRFANRDTKRNFDVKGMQEVIDAMNALAGSKFGDITKAISDQKLEARYDYTVGGKRYVGKGDPITGKTGASKDAAESVLQVHSEQVNLSLTADSAKAMTEQVSKAIESVTQQSKMPNLGTLKLELKNGDSQDVLEVLTTAEGVRIIERIAEQSTQNSARAVAR